MDPSFDGNDSLCSSLLLGETATVSSEGRLAPLFDDGTDDQPFLMTFAPDSEDLHPLLQRAESRSLPCLGRFDATLGRIVVAEDLQSAAISPLSKYGAVVLAFYSHGEQDKLTGPKRRRGCLSVSHVLEVIQGIMQTVEGQLIPPAGSSEIYRHGESALLRTPDGTWFWRGLAEAQDEPGVWTL